MIVGYRVPGLFQGVDDVAYLDSFVVEACSERVSVHVRRYGVDVREPLDGLTGTSCGSASDDPGRVEDVGRRLGNGAESEGHCDRKSQNDALHVAVQ